MSDCTVIQNIGDPVIPRLSAEKPPVSLSKAREWSLTLSDYRGADHLRSVIEIIVTLGPFMALWGAMWLLFHLGYWWLSALLWVPTSGFLVRLFMIQHDCGHGSFFRNRRLNDMAGRVLGVLTLTPYGYWRRTHALHHASSGNLDRRGIGDIDTLTLREYLARSPWQRLRYRLYRHPLVMFGLGPAYLFLLQNRLPIALLRGGWQPWFSAMTTNIAIGLLVATMVLLVGVGPFLFLHLPITLLAASIGVWLFYVQHQFEHTLWAHNQTWSLHDAALHGSSYYDLPVVLRWFTANIGVHHVHHLCSRIPFYRLPRVLKENPELAGIGRLSLLESIRCVRLVLWDEDSELLISFREAHTNLDDAPAQAKRRAEIGRPDNRGLGIH